MSSSDTSLQNANDASGNCSGGADRIAAIGCPLVPSSQSSQRAFDPRCGNCGYLLTGLPSGGICPECGCEYDESELVIAGWAAGPHESVETATPKRVWRAALLSLGFVWAQIFIDLLQHRLTDALEWCGCGIVLLAWFFYRRWMLINEFGYTAHVRISPRGIAQRQGFGPVNLLPWAANLKFSLTPRPGGIQLLSVSRVGLDKRSQKQTKQWPIAFDFECSSEQADHLRKVLAAWARLA
jgi:hypothetical protein